MRRFIEQQKLIHLKQLMSQETCDARRTTLRAMQYKVRRLLAMYNASARGTALDEVWRRHILRPSSQDRSLTTHFQSFLETAQKPFLVLDPNAGINIIDVNDAYAAATMINRTAVTGERMFDVFPDNPNQDNADGVSNLFASLCTAAATGRPHRMAIQRYDVRDGTGKFVERYWQPLNTPLYDEQGKLVYLLHHAIDVTKEISMRGHDDRPRTH